MPVGRPSKYFFLIERLNDRELYCSANIAWLLTTEDLKERKNITGTLKHARLKVRMSLARVARKHRIKPCGISYTGEGKTGNAYPAYRGKVWKLIFEHHDRKKLLRRRRA